MTGTDEQELTATERMVLVECCARMKAIAASKAPPKLNRWARAEHDEAKRHGPEWKATWFGEGRTVPDRVRVKLLRALRRLEERGLVVTTTVGDSGRLSRVKPTAEGERVAATSVKDDAETVKGSEERSA